MSSHNIFLSIEFDFQRLCLPAHLPSRDPALLELFIVKAVYSQGSQRKQIHMHLPEKTITTWLTGRDPYHLSHIPMFDGCDVLWTYVLSSYET